MKQQVFKKGIGPMALLFKDNTLIDAIKVHTQNRIQKMFDMFLMACCTQKS